MGRRTSRGRGNPKKDPAARRRRVGRPTTVSRPRLQIPQDVRVEVLTEVVQTVSPETAPILLCAGLWMLAGTWADHAGNNCIDGCLTLRFALEHFGIASRVELLGVAIQGADGTVTRHFDDRPHWNPDGTFNGHAVLVVADGPFLVDATLPQFPQVPADSMHGQVLPVVVRLAGDSVFDGSDRFAVPREDHGVIYLPAPVDPGLLAAPNVQRAEPAHRHAATNLATNTLGVLASDVFTRAFPTLPYPRLQHLRDSVAGARLIEDPDTDTSFFRTPTGAEIRLSDIA